MDLALQGVSVRLAGREVLRQLSLQIQDRELFFILGPSGGGKTTLLRLLAGFVAADQGQIRFGSRTVNDLPAHQRQTAMVFQSPALWPHLTVEDNLGYGLDVRRTASRERQERIAEILAITRLEGLAKRFPGELSGGQQQRVALARALVVRPAVLLLDEPLSNLDRPLRRELREEIRRLHAALGLTMVYVSHDSEEAFALADRAAILKDGRIVQTGHPLDLFERPSNRFVADFLGCMNWVAGECRRSNSGTLEIDTDCGRFIASGAAFDGTGLVWVGFRPRHLHPGPAGINSLVLTPVERRCAGEYDEWVMKSRGGNLLKLHTSGPTTPFPLLSESVFSIASEHLVVVPHTRDPAFPA